ncbi:MAG: SdpI family protein [Candidatus Nanoarchaeia archaeon]|nr:SdpI family protein [Candidatus Nanoarchaeia archaeon]MDD5238973.1 SdpI family protein [Candidatus Nanoarchaeia archaeon]
MDKKEFVAIAVLLLVFLAGIYFYPQLPQQVASHWNAGGEVNGYMDKTWAVFLLPALAVVIYLLMTFLPYIMPNKDAILKFRHYFTIKLSMVLFISTLYLYTLLFSLGFQLSMNIVMPVLFGALFIVIGYSIRDVSHNYFLGIRTPWTLSDKTVWKKTHEFGSKTFMIAGVACIISIIAGSNAFWVSMAAIMIGALAPVVYSYLEFRSLRKK